MAKSDMTDTEIEEELRQKIADGSQDPEDYRNLTDLLFPSGDYDEAIALYQRALTLPLTAFKKAQLSMELGWIYYEIGQQTQVAELARDALSLLSTEQYAQALQREERFAEAEQAITEAFRFGKNYKSGLLHSRLDVELGEIQRSTNRLAESKESFRQALAALKSDPYFHNDTQTLGEVYFNLASVCYELGEYEDAVSSYNEVLRCDPKNGSSYWTALYCLGRSYEANGDRSKARDCYREVSASSHATKEDKSLAQKGLMWVLAKLDYESGKYNEAAAAFEEVISHYTKEDSDYWPAIVWLGSCYEGLGAYAKAQTLYEQVLDSPHTSDANKVIARRGLARSLARHFYEAREYKEAVTRYEEVLGHYPETDPNRWNTMIWLGSCYQGLGAYAKEQECYQRVLASRYAADADKLLARKN
jgi:tetratricopeptide (TPR) repeat protein